MSPTILPPAMGKIVGQTGLFNLGMATNLGEGKLCYTCLNSILKIKKIDLVLHPGVVGDIYSVSSRFSEIIRMTITQLFITQYLL